MVYNNYEIKRLHTYSSYSFNKILNFMFWVAFSLVLAVVISTLHNLSPLTKQELPLTKQEIINGHNAVEDFQEHIGYNWASEAWLYDY